MLLEQRVFLLTMVIYRYIWNYIWKLETCQHVESSTPGKVATAARSEQLLPHVGNYVPACEGIAIEAQPKDAASGGDRGMSPPCTDLCRWSTLREKEE